MLKETPNDTNTVSYRDSLNPYFNGTCSKRRSLFILTVLCTCYVLILILMEHAQRVIRVHDKVFHLTEVLILILMEHAQRVNRTTMILKDFMES